MTDRVARRVVVDGRVQGVFFRDETRRQARRLGVSGWVRNCPDGTVEAHLEGPPSAVDGLVRWLHEGPPHADVSAVRVGDAEPEGRDGFVVR
jgi:acylphosphatase